jgi:hypothetical protein
LCCSGSKIANFNATQASVAEVSFNSSLYLDSCDLVSNTASQSSPGVIRVHTFSKPSAVAVAGGSQVATSVPLFTIDYKASGTFYSSPPQDVWDDETQTTFKSKGITASQTTGEQPLLLAADNPHSSKARLTIPLFLVACEATNKVEFDVACASTYCHFFIT